MEWVSRIFAVALLMILPALGGRWLDQQFGTQFLTLIGILLGVTCGITVLVCLAQIAENQASQSDHTASSSSETRTKEQSAETRASADVNPSSSEPTSEDQAGSD